MAKSLDEFRNFVIGQNPNISAQELKRLDEFIMQKRADQLSTSGIRPEDIPTNELGQQVLTRQIQAGTYTPKVSEDVEKKQRAKADAERIIAQLEDAYFTGNNGKGLGYGKLGGIMKNIELITNTGETIPPELEDLSTYKALRLSVRPTFARAAGDVGNFSLPEQKAAVANIPAEFETIGQAKKYFSSMRQKFGISGRDYNNMKKQTTQPSARFKIEAIE